MDTAFMGFPPVICMFVFFTKVCVPFLPSSTATVKENASVKGLVLNIKPKSQSVNLFACLWNLCFCNTGDFEM